MKVIWVAALCSLVAGCAGVADSGANGPAQSNGTGGISGGGATGGSNATGGSGGTTLPPEIKVESSYEVPVATGSYIWVANPDSGRVAYVAAATLEVHTVEAGNAPTYMSAIPSTTDDAVVVLNVLSQDATILRVAPSGQLTKSTVSGVAAGANALAVSGDGRWALAWTDARTITTADPLAGYQAVTLIDLSATAPSGTILSVGFRPVDVAYASDGSAVFAVTEDGVSVIDLTASPPHVSGSVPLTNNLTDNADTRDVSITPNGRLAVVRREGSATVGIVDLTTGTLGSIDLSGPVTDVEVTADGSNAVAVVRDTSEVAVIPLAAGIPDPSSVQQIPISGETVGSASIAADGQTVLLYTNAIAADRLTVLTLGQMPSYRVVQLHAPVLAVFASADAANVVVFHSESMPAAGDGGITPTLDGGTALASDAGIPSQIPTNAFSLVPLGADLPAEIEETDVPPQSVAISPAGDRVMVTERDDAKQIFGAYVGQFPTLEVQKIELASPPIAVGVLASANLGYVAQKNAEGRLTVVALDSGQARTLTGFEIGAGVVDWAEGSVPADGGMTP